MPKRKNGISEKYLKYIEGDNAECAYNLQQGFITMNLSSGIERMDKHLHNEYLSLNSEYEETCCDRDEGGKNVSVTPIRFFQGTIRARNYGGDPKMIEEMIRYNEVFKEKLSEMRQFKGAEHYKDYFDFMSLETNYDAGEYTDAYMNSMILGQLAGIIGCGPKLTTKDEVGSDGKVTKVIDFKGIEEKLRKPDGSGFFVPYMNICKAGKLLWDLEVEKVRNERIGWTLEAEKDFLKRYKEANKRFTDNFVKLRDVVKANPGLYNGITDNHPEHMVDYERDNNKEYGFMIGQQKAIENGWNADELPLLGMLEEISHRMPIQHDRQGRAKKKDNALKEKVKLEEELKNISNEIEALKKRVIDENTAKLVADLELANKAVIEAHQKYEEERHKIQVKPEMTLKEQEVALNNLKAENQDNEKLYEAYQSKRKELDLEKIISDKEKRLKSLPNLIKKQDDYVKLIDQSEKDYDTFLKLTKEIKDKVYNTKVTSIEDKKAIIEAFSDYLDETSTLVMNPDNGGVKYGNDYNDHFKRQLDKIKERYDTGIGNDFKNNHYADTRLQNILDIYGPRPRYYTKWGKDNVISKNDFNDSITPYDEREFPFTEKDMAFLGMAGTLSAVDEIMAANKGEGREYEDVLRETRTRWMEDVSMHEDGPRQDFSRYRHIVAKGRENAVAAMRAYNMGDPSKIAEIIYDGLHNICDSCNNLSTYDGISVNHYGMISTFMDMLRNDPKIAAAFDKYNNSLEPERRIDFDKVRSICAFAKMRMETLGDDEKYREVEQKVADKEKEIAEARKQIDDLKKKIADNKKKPAEEQEDLSEDAETLEDLKAEVYDYTHTEAFRDQARVAIRERNARKGVIFRNMFTAANNLLRANPKIYDANMQNAKDVEAAQKAGKSSKALEDVYSRFLYENGKLNGAFEYLGTIEGKKDFNDFVEMLYDKYGITFSNGEQGYELYSDKGPVKKDPSYQAELSLFISKMENKQILRELNSKEHTKDQMRELASKYMINCHRIYLLNEQLNSGVAEPHVNFDERSLRKDMDWQRAFTNSVDKFVANFDMSSMDSKEFAEVLANGTESLLDTTKNISHLLDEKKWADINEREKFKLPAISNAVEQLTAADKGVLFGSKEYKSILEDIKKLDEDIKRAEEDFKKAEGFTYNGRDLAHREKDLINRLNSYIERKDTELKVQAEGKKNETSLSRMNAAKASLELLQARLKMEVNSPTITAQGREDASILAEYVTLSNDEKNRITERKDKVEAGMDILKATIEEYDYQRLKSATVLISEEGKTNEKRGIYRDSFDETIKGALYCDMLMTAFSPGVNDNPKTLAEKDLKLKMMLRKSVEESKSYRMLDKVMKTKFGERLKDKLFKGVTEDGLKPADLKGVLEHVSIIEERDRVLKECFKEEMDKYNEFLTEADKQLDRIYNEKNRRNDINSKLKEIEKYETRIDSLISLSEQLSSNALEDSAKQFEKVKKERIERNNKREEKRTARKQAAIEKMNKAAGNKNTSADNKGKNKEEVKNTGMHV